MNLHVRRLTKTAKLPVYAHPGDAGLDLFADQSIDILPGQRYAVNTGIALAIPKEHVGLVWDKSGIALSTGITILAGVIDAGYRGEVQVVIYNTSREQYHVEAGQKIAQLLIQPVLTVQIKETTTLEDTERGLNGFGSSGI